MKKNIYFHTNLIAWALVFFLMGNYAFGWTTPTQSPPDGDLSAPLDVSSSAQTKTGGLYIATVSGSVGIGTADPSYTLDVTGTGRFTQPVIVGTPTAETHAATKDYVDTNLAGDTYWTQSGSYLYAEDIGWNVGIATTTPSYKLEVGSGGSLTARFGTAAADEVTIGGGSGKLTVGTIDPIYTINNEQYATYLAGMIGVKEEITGVIKLQKSQDVYSYIIDFDDLEVGSDLWLFAKTTNLKENFDKMIVLLTPAFDGKTWYEKDVDKNHLMIFAIPSSISDSNLEVSYRFTAPRFDSNQWTNYSDSESKGFNLDELLE